MKYLSFVAGQQSLKHDLSFEFQASYTFVIVACNEKVVFITRTYIDLLSFKRLTPYSDVRNNYKSIITNLIINFCAQFPQIQILTALRLWNAVLKHFSPWPCLQF